MPIPVCSEKIGFSYDAIGNRIKREAIVPTTPAPKHNSPISLFNHVNVTAYPNPTSDIVDISINSLSEFPEIHLYHFSGIYLGSYTLEENRCRVDLSIYPAGVYLFYFPTNSGEDDLTDNQCVKVVKR